MKRPTVQQFLTRPAAVVILGITLCFLAIACDGPAGVATSEGPALAPPTKDIVFTMGVSTDADPAKAGRAAAAAAKELLAGSPVKAVLIAECYEDKARKASVLSGVCDVFDRKLVHGEATYGAFTQDQVAAEEESVVVLAIAGKDIDVKAACRRELGIVGLTPAEHEAQIEKKLLDAGADLARQLPKTPRSRVTLVMADAHSPSNAHLVRGMQTVLGKDFPITGGSANKNAGQTFVYFRGQMLADSAIALMLSGDFKVALAGRKAKDNDAVIATARQAAAAALKDLANQGARPAAAIAFDCAGRKSKLDNIADELAALQKPLGKKMPLFGTYNAGEIGPADTGEGQPGCLSSGVGWHVMVTVLGW